MASSLSAHGPERPRTGGQWDTDLRAARGRRIERDTSQVTPRGRRVEGRHARHAEPAPVALATGWGAPNRRPRRLGWPACPKSGRAGCREGGATWVGAAYAQSEVS